MMFWNRIEIYNGLSMKEFSDLRDSLADAGIQYDYRIISLNPSRKRTGSSGLHNNDTTQYYLYVHQKDYYHAMHLTSRRKA